MRNNFSSFFSQCVQLVMVGIVFEGGVITFAKSLIKDGLNVEQIRNNWISGK